MKMEAGMRSSYLCRSLTWLSTLVSFIALQENIFAQPCPCDIFAAGGTPCVAAFSTTRALYASYNGPLYQVRHLPDTANKIDIYPLSPGGSANAAVQDSFLGSNAGSISKIYDQSGNGNHLIRSPGGAQVCEHKDLEAVANALPLMLGGRKVYGIKVVPDNNSGCTPPADSVGTGYRLDSTKGIATEDQAESEYMVTSGTYQNSGCCYDFGNVETNNEDDGAATMEAIYMGGGAGWGHGGGSGPWVMADMENGIFSGSTNANTGNTSVPYPYVTAGLIGRAGGTYALLAGNAQNGALTTMYDGSRPSGYTTMKKQGAITLGPGGDNSDHGKGYFYEGVMTSGAATVATMNLVQANIVAAGYGDSTLRVSVRPGVTGAATAFQVKVRYVPSTGSAVMNYVLQNSARVSITIIDQRGRHIASVVNEVRPAGRNEAIWGFGRVRAGVYLWRIAVEGNDASTGKFVIGK